MNKLNPLHSLLVPYVPKPKIVKNSRDEWECFSRNISGFGKTAQLAFKDWRWKFETALMDKARQSVTGMRFTNW